MTGEELSEKIHKKTTYIIDTLVNPKNPNNFMSPKNSKNFIWMSQKMYVKCIDAVFRRVWTLALFCTASYYFKG